MVKLASARENRMYGPRLSRNRSEYTNAGIFVFSTILILCGLASQFSYEPKSGIVVLLISLLLLTLVNLHDLIAHLSSIDFRFSLFSFDLQLALVEFSVPFLHILGNILHFLAFLFLLLQAEKGGYSYLGLEKHALNMLIAGAILWLLGSIHNSCQIYERADGHVQILQQSVHIPFLLGSCLFLVAAVLNRWEQARYVHHGLDLLGSTYIWLGMAASALFFIGGINNVTKVFKMQQASGLRLEKLRGGAQDQLIQIHEGRMPLIMEESRIRKKEERSLERGGGGEREEEVKRPPPAAAAVVPRTPYKDVLVGQA